MCGSLAAGAGTFKSRNNRLLPGTRASNFLFMLDCCLGRAQDVEYNQHNGGSVPQVQSGKVTVCVVCFKEKILKVFDDKSDLRCSVF